MTPRRRVVITGIGLLSPCGVGVEASWAAVLAGRSGIAPITRFDASRLPTRFAGEVKGFDPLAFMDRKQAKRLDRYQQFAMAAAEMAMQDAGLTGAPGDPERAAVLVGSCVGGLAIAEEATLAAYGAGSAAGAVGAGAEPLPLPSPDSVSPFFILNVLINMAASHLSIRYGFKGPSWSTSSACATSAHALGEAMRLIERGEADLVLAGGAEAPIGFMCVAGFNAIRALSTRNDDPAGASQPFGAERDGFVLGEGAAILVLESLEQAMARGARIYAELAGYGSSSDAFHMTAPPSNHEGAQRAMRLALADADLSPAEIGYINAHATSTPLGDVAEAVAIEAVFGARGGGIPVSSTKSMTGHLTGAAGAAEAIFTVLALRDQRLPPTINLARQDPAVTLDCIPEGARAASVTAAMTNSFGFGGTNAVLVLRRLDRE